MYKIWEPWMTALAEWGGQGSVSCIVGKMKGTTIISHASRAFFLFLLFFLFAPSAFIRRFTGDSVCTSGGSLEHFSFPLPLCLSAPRRWESLQARCVCLHSVALFFFTARKDARNEKRGGINFSRCLGGFRFFISAHFSTAKRMRWFMALLAGSIELQLLWLNP